MQDIGSSGKAFESDDGHIYFLISLRAHKKARCFLIESGAGLKTEPVAGSLEKFII
jgi:hypothetical protein